MDRLIHLPSIAGSTVAIGSPQHVQVAVFAGADHLEVFSVPIRTCWVVHWLITNIEVFRHDLFLEISDALDFQHFHNIPILGQIVKHSLRLCLH